MTDQQMISTNAVAKLMGVSRATIVRMRARGTMPQPVQIGRVIRWRRDAVNEWIASGCPNCAGASSVAGS